MTPQHTQDLSELANRVFAAESTLYALQTSLGCGDEFAARFEALLRSPDLDPVEKADLLGRQQEAGILFLSRAFDEGKVSAEEMLDIRLQFARRTYELIHCVLPHLGAQPAPQR